MVDNKETETGQIRPFNERDIGAISGRRATYAGLRQYYNTQINAYVDEINGISPGSTGFSVDEAYEIGEKIETGRKIRQRVLRNFKIKRAIKIKDFRKERYGRENDPTVITETGKTEVTDTDDQNYGTLSKLENQLRYREDEYRFNVFRKAGLEGKKIDKNDSEGKEEAEESKKPNSMQLTPEIEYKIRKLQLEREAEMRHYDEVEMEYRLEALDIDYEMVMKSMGSDSIKNVSGTKIEDIDVGEIIEGAKEETYTEKEVEEMMKDVGINDPEGAIKAYIEKMKGQSD